jgi:hypothetical protein
VAPVRTVLKGSAFLSITGCFRIAETVSRRPHAADHRWQFPDGSAALGLSWRTDGTARTAGARTALRIPGPRHDALHAPPTRCVDRCRAAMPGRAVPRSARRRATGGRPRGRRDRCHPRRRSSLSLRQPAGPDNGLQRAGDPSGIWTKSSLKSGFGLGAGKSVLTNCAPLASAASGRVDCAARSRARPMPTSCAPPCRRPGCAWPRTCRAARR